MFNLLQNGMKSLIKKITIKELSEKDLKPIIQELTELMISNEVAVEAADQIGKNLQQELVSVEAKRFKNATPIVKDALRKSVMEVLSVPEESQIDLLKGISKAKAEKRPYIICMLGINGTGKTTSMAKLAHFLQKKKFSVVFVAGDTFRAGSIEQLGQHANKLGIKMISNDYKGDPAAAAIDAIDHAESKGIDVVMIDTAGRMQNNINLVRELEKIVRISEPDVKIFVGDSLAGNDVLRQAKQFNHDIGIDGIIMTKFDSDAKGGAIISVAHITKKPIMFLGNGQSYDDLIEFDPKKIVDYVVPN